MTYSELKETNHIAGYVTKPNAKVLYLLSSFHYDSLPPALVLSPPGCPVGFSDTCQEPNSLSSPLRKTHSSSSCLFNNCPFPSHLPWEILQAII